MVAEAAAAEGKASSEMPAPAGTAMRRRCEEIPEGAKASTVLGLRKRQRRLTWERRARRRSSPPPVARGTFILVLIMMCAVFVNVLGRRGGSVQIRKCRGTYRKCSEFP
jgi:hypothetical protein